LGQNIGNEEFGKGNEFQRPVLIIKKLTKNIFIGVPLITTLKENDYFHQFKYSN
jgi:mRNA interferase MazF